jgi:hypothetical protein
MIHAVCCVVDISEEVAEIRHFDCLFPRGLPDPSSHQIPIIATSWPIMSTLLGPASRLASSAGNPLAFERSPETIRGATLRLACELLPDKPHLGRRSTLYLITLLLVIFRTAPDVAAARGFPLDSPQREIAGKGEDASPNLKSPSLREGDPVCGKGAR